MSYTFDYANNQINVVSPQTVVDCLDLYDSIANEQASERGIAFSKIGSVSGGESLGAGVAVGITVNLLSPWQIKFYTGNYIATVQGGNLVGGLGGDPVAYSAGVQVLLIQSAASTVVTAGGSIPTAADNAAATVSALNQTTIPVNAMQMNSNTIIGTGLDGDPWRGVNVQP